MPPKTVGDRALRLHARDLSVGRSAHALLAAGIDVEVAPGRVLAVLGPSGAGKSTLLDTLEGVLPPLDGEVRFVDADGASHLPEAVRGSVSRVAQDLLLVGPSSLERNVCLGRLARHPWWRTLLNFPRDERAEARELLERLGLGALADRAAASVSGGERQRTAVARALFAEPAVLFADEPTANLDARSAELVLSMLREHARRTPAAVVVVLHDPRLAERFADDVLAFSERP